MKYLSILIMSLFCCLAQAEVKFQYTANYYKFDALDISDLVKNIKEKGPKIGGKDAWAIIKWDLNTQYSFKSTDSGCNIVIDDIELVANVTLPNWQDVKGKSAFIRDWWGKYSAFIKQHEDLHFESALSSAKTFEKQLLKMKEQVDCKKVKLKYLILKSQFIVNVNLDDKKIDKRSKRLFDSSDKLFAPLNNHGSVSFESGGMSSYIRL